MLHRPARPGDVVDVDARDIRARHVALEDDREVIAQERHQRRIVRPRPRDDDAIGVLRPKEGGTSPQDRRGRATRPSRASRRLSPPPPTRAASRRGSHPGQLFGRLAHDQGDDVTPAARQLAGRTVRVVVQALRGGDHTLARLVGSSCPCVRWSTKDTVVRDDTGLQGRTSALVGRLGMVDSHLLLTSRQ